MKIIHHFRVLFITILFFSNFQVLSAQKTVSFGGQYSTLYRVHGKYRITDDRPNRFVFQEYIKRNIQAPGLIMTLSDSSRWEQVISIVALEFDGSTEYIANDLFTAQPAIFYGFEVDYAYTHFEYGVRYRIFKEPSFWLQPYIGLSLEPIIERVTVDPVSNEAFDWDMWNMSLATSSVLQLKFRITDRLSVDLNGHLWLGELYLESSRTSDPLSGTEIKSSSTLAFDAIPDKYRGTLAVTYRL